jgi:predicted GNAT family N-acyltransferase
MVGFIALRDGSHLFNLFVRRSHLRRGIARALWRHALRHVRQPSTASGFTVNASLNAVVVYRALGFKEVGSVVRQHGIEFVPMLYSSAQNAA